MNGKEFLRAVDLVVKEKHIDNLRSDEKCFN